MARRAPSYGAAEQSLAAAEAPRVTIASSFRSKYATVAQMLAGASGTLLDVGARDCTLQRRLPASVEYRSGDIDAGCDFVIDLERRLQFADGSFDYVVALDVLEHVDNFHAAFGELLRIARRRVIVALPNMAFLPHRLAFALNGRLNTDKYDLAIAARGDRHRWLTTNAQAERFMTAPGIAGERFALDTIVREAGGSRPVRLLWHGLMRAGVPVAGFATDRTIFSFSSSKGR